jgi:hypothetical protein
MLAQRGKEQWDRVMLGQLPLRAIKVVLVAEQEPLD